MNNFGKGKITPEAKNQKANLKSEKAKGRQIIFAFCLLPFDFPEGYDLKRPNEHLSVVLFTGYTGAGFNGLRPQAP